MNFGCCFFAPGCCKAAADLGRPGWGPAEAPRCAGAQCSLSGGVRCHSAGSAVVYNKTDAPPPLLAARCAFVEQQHNVLCRLWRNNGCFFPAEHRRLAENVG